jgi:hypothetical protein
VTVSLRIVRRALLVTAVLLAVAALAAVTFVCDWPARRYLIFYLAPLFLAAPLWVRLRLADWPPRYTTRIAIDAIVFGLSFARFVSGELLPFSGHTLFLTYSLVTTASLGYRIAAVVLIADTTVFKLWIWHDVASWSIGIGLGLVAAVLWMTAPHLFRVRDA